MTTRTRICITLLVVLTLGVTGAVSGQTGVYPVDSDHPLTQDQQITEFQASGVASANLTALDLGVTVAEDHDQAGMSGFYTDTGKIWLCLDYRESISRTIRIHLPQEYFTPRPGEVESVTSDHMATLTVRGDGEEYTAATVEFNDSSRACFPISKSSGTYWSAKSDFNSWVNNTTGWKMPTFRDTAEEWRALPEQAFQNSTMYRIPTKGQEVSIQYDARAGPETRWLRVPECSDISQQQICRYREETDTTNRENDSVVLMSTKDTPPAVRFKYGSDTSAGLVAGLRDIQGAVDSFAEDISGWLGGGSSSDSGGGS